MTDAVTALAEMYTAALNRESEMRKTLDHEMAENSRLIDAAGREYDMRLRACRVEHEARLAEAVAAERQECLKIVMSSPNKFIAAARLKARGK